MQGCSETTQPGAPALTQVVAAEAGFHLHGAEWLVVLGAALVGLVVLGVVAVLIWGVPVLGLAPTGIHFSHKSKRLTAATTMVVVLVVVGVGLVVNRNHGSPRRGDGVTHLAAGATTLPSNTSNDPGTTGTTETTRPSTHRRSKAVTTSSATSGTSAVPGSSTTAGETTPIGHTPTTKGRAPRRNPTGTTTPRRKPTTTTTRPGTTTTTQPGTTTTTEAPTTTQPEPPTTTVPPLVGDINLDGLVGCMDESLLVPEIGEVGSGLPGDLNHDGAVDTSDLDVMLANWTGDGTIWVNPLNPLQICT